MSPTSIGGGMLCKWQGGANISTLVETPLKENAEAFSLNNVGVIIPDLGENIDKNNDK